MQWHKRFCGGDAGHHTTVTYIVWSGVLWCAVVWCVVVWYGVVWCVVVWCEMCVVYYSVALCTAL